MLILSRKIGEEIVISCKGEDIRVVVYRAESKRVKIGIEASKEVSIMRKELLNKKS